MFIVVAIVSIVLSVHGVQRHAPTLWLLAGVALGCLGVEALATGLFRGFMEMDHPSGRIGGVVIVGGLVAIVAGGFMVVFGAVLATIRASRRN